MDDSIPIITQIKPKQIDIYKQENKLTNLMIINLAKIRFGGSGGGNSPAKPEDFFQETYTANGNYDVAPQAGHVFRGGQVEVDVHPTDKLTRTYTENDTYLVSGEWTDAEITVNVQPRLQTKEATPLTLAQTVSPDAGYDGLQSVTVTGVTSEIDSNITADNIKKDVTILGVTGTLESGIIPTGTINISDNGTYDVTDKATAVVAVGGTDYRYKNGTPDTIGLAAIGWTADDIGYYGANAPHYVWENDNYKVSQKNIDLYSLDDPQPSLYKNDPEVTFVPNKNMSSYFNSEAAFQSMKYIRSIPLYDTSSVTGMSNMFRECSSLQTISPLNTSSCTNMSYMFYFCPSLQTVPLLDTSSVTNMFSMFHGCSNLTSIPPLDTSSVTSMGHMFRECSSLATIPLLDTSSVTDMGYMFSGCSSLASIPQLDTSNVTNMSNMFDSCKSLTSIPALDTSKVTETSDIFKDCSRLKSVEFDQSSLAKNSTGSVGYYSMFSGCSSLERVKFTGSTPTTGGNSVQYMFFGCDSLQSVEGVDFSKVSDDLNYLFGFTSNLPNLTRFIVIGKINTGSTDDYGFKACTNLDFDSIKSILEAMNRTDNTNSKTMMFNRAIVDQNGELAGLVSSCATKGWTITGLTILERPELEFTLSPSKPTVSEFRKIGSLGGTVTLTIDATHPWQNYKFRYDYYSIATGEKVRDGQSSDGNMFDIASGDIGVTTLHRGIWTLDNMRPQSGEFVRIYARYKIPSTGNVLTFEADLEND